MDNLKQKPLNFRELMQSFYKKGNSVWLICCVAGVGILLLLSGGEKNALTKPEAMPTEISTGEQGPYQTEIRLEQDLMKILAQVSGVGKVSVDVSLKSSGQKIWERQSRLNKRVSQQDNSLNTEEDSSEELVFAKGNDGRNSPILKEEIAPVIQGVVVVASGAKDSRICRLITETVITILDLPAHRVLVVAGELERNEIDE